MTSFFGEMHTFMDAFINLWKVEEAVEERKNFERMMEKKARLEALSSSGDKRDKDKKNKDNKGEKKAESGSPLPDTAKGNLKKKFARSNQAGNASPSGESGEVTSNGKHSPPPSDAPATTSAPAPVPAATAAAQPTATASPAASNSAATMRNKFRR